MVEPPQRWLLNPAPLLHSLRAPQPFITPQTPSPDPSTTALSRCKPGIAQSIVVLTGDSSQALGSKCQYTDLTREHAAAHAHALLARLQPDAEQKATVPDDVFQQALALGKHSCCLLYCKRKRQTLRTCMGGYEGLVPWGLCQAWHCLYARGRSSIHLINEWMNPRSSMCLQAFSSWQRIPGSGPVCALLCRKISGLCSTGNRLPLQLLWVCQG